MNKSKMARLERHGWKVGTPAEFLNLTPDEIAYIELKLHLSHSLQARRRKRQITQQQLARLLRSSQSRVAKMEAGDPSVSLDLLVRSLLVLGAPPKSLRRALPL